NAPDLWKVGTKRDQEFLRNLLKDPDKTLGKKGKMVKYHLDDADREALVSYLRSIDFTSYKARRIEPSLFRSAHIIYRDEKGITNRDLIGRTQQIAALLEKNKEEFKEKSPLAKTPAEEIAKLAGFFAATYK
ncbi:MAG: hypothetical protein ACYC6Q_12715, partial [Syntrophales bacterium]